MGKVFDSRKTGKEFFEMSEMLTEGKKKIFADSVRALSEKKKLSEEGEYSEFYVTQKDLRKLFKEVTKK